MPLSKRQNKRLGAILSVMFEEETPQEHLEEVVKEGFVSKKGEVLFFLNLISRYCPTL